MRNLAQSAAFVCLIGFTGAAEAKMPVEIGGTTPDTVGQRLVYALKEGIRTSSSLDLTFASNQPRLQVKVVTLDTDMKGTGYSTTYSAVILWNNPKNIAPFYLTQYVGYCGSSRVVECASGLVANVSEQSDEMLKLFALGLKK
jgi:hypothetical protein